MDPITTWQLGISGLGFTDVYPNSWRFAGGFLYVGLNDSGGGADWSVFSLGDSKVALGWATVDQDQNAYQFYWMLSKDMMLWLDGQIDSNSIGPYQTFTLENLGDGNISLYMGGWYLSGQPGGWYVQNFGFGYAEIILTNTPAAWQVLGDQLPILQITNSGYQLDLSNRSLGKLDLTRANMKQCNLSGADLSQVTSIEGADFTDARLIQQARLNNQDLGKASTWLNAHFDNTDLTTIATAAGARMEKVTFNQATLTKVHFNGAHLAEAVFHGATLDGTDFTGADLSGADFSNARSLKNTIFSGATLHGTIFNNTDLSSAVFDESPKFTRQTSARTQFQRATVPFRALNSNWSYLDLTGATITDIPQSIANLNADQALLPEGLSLQGVDLTEASFQGTRMYRIQLQDANLQGATMTGALLKGARLNEANLTLADLTRAWLIVETATPKTPVDKLEAASLTGAFMFNTVLDQAHCDGVDFSGANLSTSLLKNKPASAVNASMNDAMFNGTWVAQAIFDGAQLSGANLAFAHLVGTSFKDNGGNAVQLTPSIRVGTAASINTADISGTDFTGANMDGLDMDKATVATTGAPFQQIFPGYKNTEVMVSFNYGPTKFGNTTAQTTCPNGEHGPCSV
jgi:uncharacterized protein YjbI with pentapeptide repeats